MTDVKDMTAEEFAKEVRLAEMIRNNVINGQSWPSGWNADCVVDVENENLARLRGYEALVQLGASYCDNTGGGCEDCGNAGSGKVGCPGRIISEALTSARIGDAGKKGGV